MHRTIAEKNPAGTHRSEDHLPWPDRQMQTLTRAHKRITAPLAIKSFREMGATRVFDKDKVVFVCDHFTPNKVLGENWCLWTGFTANLWP